MVGRLAFSQGSPFGVHSRRGFLTKEPDYRDDLEIVSLLVRNSSENETSTVGFNRLVLKRHYECMQ